MPYSVANMHQLNWQHLRYLLAVSNEGSVAAAARLLNVNRSTVLRRINQFQDELKCQLFERSDSGYSLTPEAEQMIEVAQDVEEKILSVQRKIEGKKLKIAGDLHITTTDSIMDSLLVPNLKSFVTQHPDIVLHMHVTSQLLHLGRRDADIAIRPTISPPEHLVGKKLTDLKIHVFASKQYLLELKQNKKDIKWIGFNQNLLNDSTKLWLEKHVEKNQFIMYCDSFVAIKKSIENHLGFGLLPDYLAKGSIGLERVETPDINDKVGLWILTHPDLIRSAKVHAFYKHFKSVFDSNDHV